MSDYLQALHQNFFREPEHTDLHEDIRKLQQELESDGLFNSFFCLYSYKTILPLFLAFIRL